MRLLPLILTGLMVMAGCRTPPSQQPVAAPAPLPPWVDPVPDQGGQSSTNERPSAYRARWRTLTPEQRNAIRSSVRERLMVNPELETQMSVVSLVVGTNGCRLIYKSTVEGRAKAEGSYTTKGIMYTAYAANGRPVFRGFVHDPRHVEVEADGKIQAFDLPEADLTVRVPASAVRIVLRKWDSPERVEGVPPVPPSQNIIGEIDL